MNWQPIETAPKDGTPILVYERGHVIHVKWGGPKHVAFVNIPNLGFSDYPTHWMPLPEPPAAEKGSQ